MDGLDSAKCQKSRRRDMMRISKIVNEEKDKKMNSIIFSNLKTKWVVARRFCAENKFCNFF